MQQAQSAPDINDIADTLAEFLFQEGGTLSQLYGLESTELEAAYSMGYNYYNQARWIEALQVFSFLCMNDHLERRYHVGRGACLQMLKRYDDALKAYGIAHIMDMTDPKVGFHIAECLIALGRVEDALTALEAVEAVAEGKTEFADISRRAAGVARLLRQSGAAA